MSLDAYATHGTGPTKVPKASSVLADALRTTIVRGKLEPGDPFLSEAEIIEKHGLSRATVREALRLLESEGLIVSKRGPGGGLSIGRLDLKSTARTIAMHLARSEATLGDMFTFRRMVEAESARLAAENATDAQRARLEAYVAEDAQPLIDVIDFHDLIADCTGNEFYRVVQKVVAAVATWHTPDEGIEGELSYARAAHAKIVRRILERDGEGAARAMDRHLEAFEAMVVERGNIDKPVIRAAAW